MQINQCCADTNLITCKKTGQTACFKCLIQDFKIVLNVATISFVYTRSYQTLVVNVAIFFLILKNITECIMISMRPFNNLMYSRLEPRFLFERCSSLLWIICSKVIRELQGRIWISLNVNLYGSLYVFHISSPDIRAAQKYIPYFSYWHRAFLPSTNKMYRCRFPYFCGITLISYDI